MRASRDQVGLKDRMYLVLDPGSVPNDLVAPRDEPAHALGGRIRRPDLGQVTGRVQARERAASTLSVFTCAWAIAFTCRGLAMTTRFTCIGSDLIGQSSDLGVRLRASDRSAQQATATGWLC